MITSLYLAHLNPVTNAHVEIIRELQTKSDIVQVMPVLFLKNGIEINSKSFPFSFETRKRMLESVFGDSIRVSENYAFHAPFSRYLPPLLSFRSWNLRNSILDGVKGDYFTYTGDRAEGIMLKIYRLNPKIGKRKPLSASSVKEKIYNAVHDGGKIWTNDVPDKVTNIIIENWEMVEKFAVMEDNTIRVMGMKFPREGYR